MRKAKNAARWFATFAGTGSEDYIGTGWGEGEFFNDFSGCLVADEKRLQWAFYRFQIPDPVFFDAGCRVTLQQIGEMVRQAVWDQAMPHATSAHQNVTVSVGVASTKPSGIQRPGDLIEAADAALYAAKHRGRNAVVEHGFVRATGSGSIAMAS